jgi:O-antigen/teichoic acid export membrane protein
MTILLAFFVNAALNFALGLLVAKFLGPSDFGRYAIARAIALVLTTLFFEWLRLSATRFYSEERRGSDPGIRATLALGYTGMAFALTGLVLAVFLAGVDVGLPASLLAGAAAATIGMGVFDYRAALARARFLERAYAELVLLKNAGAFVLMVGGAYLFREPTVVLAGAAVSGVVAILVARKALADPAVRPAYSERRHFKLFASYALPLVAANLVYQLIPLMNRSALALTEGYAEAGQFALAADLGMRVFMTLGSALDILLFQMAVRTEEAHGRAQAEAQIARNLAVVVALLLPLAAGYWLVLPALEALLVPASYRGAFAAYTTILIPALFAFALIQYALNPVFQLRRRTGPVVFAALAALAANAALLPILLPLWGPKGVALAQLAGLALAAVVFAILAAREGGLRLPWRDLALAAAATGAMTFAVLPLREIEPPALAFGAAVTAGSAIYGTLAYVLDIAMFRTMLRARMSRTGAVPAPAE